MGSFQSFLVVLLSLRCLMSTAIRGMGASITSKIHSVRPPVSALIVEPRCHETLPLVIANMRANLPDVPIQVFYGSSNKDFVYEFVPLLESKRWSTVQHKDPLPGKASEKSWGRTRGGWPAVTLEPLPHPYFMQMNWTSYSLLLESPEFWDQVSGEKVLMFEPDSWVCRHADMKLQKWLQYDYVGSPYNHYVKGCPGGVGNGGFSLRSRQVMRQLAAAAIDRAKESDKRGDLSVMSEDIFFCRELQRTKEKKNTDSSFTWQIPDHDVWNAQKGDMLESPSFSLFGASGRFRLRYWPKGREQSDSQYCSAFVVADDDSVAQIKVAVNDEERLLGENGPVDWKPGDEQGYTDFAKRPEKSVVVKVVLIDQSIGAQLPTRDVADAFAEEERIDLKHGDPLGVHRPWRYEAWWWELKEHCPGLHILGRAWNKNPTGPIASCRASWTSAKDHLDQYHHFVSTVQMSSARFQPFGLKHFLWIFALGFIRLSPG